MFKIESNKIHLTRGDAATIRVSAKNSDNTDYTFQVGEIVRLNVFKRKDCNCIVLTKDVTVSTSGTSVDLSLASTDTKIGDLINKPITYWYEIVLITEAGEQTIVGYDTDGSKDFILYPEGKEGE